MKPITKDSAKGSESRIMHPNELGLNGMPGLEAAAEKLYRKRRTDRDEAEAAFALRHPGRTVDEYWNDFLDNYYGKGDAEVIARLNTREALRSDFERVLREKIYGCDEEKVARRMMWYDYWVAFVDWKEQDLRALEKLFPITC